jgi:hypothetical protein
MGEIVTIILLCSSALTSALFWVSTRRRASDRFTREWINFLQEDLTLTRT